MVTVMNNVGFGLAIVSIASLAVCPLANSQEVVDDPLFREIAAKHAEFRRYWNEGYIEARLESDLEKVDVTAWWSGDKSRRKIVDGGVANHRKASTYTILSDPESLCLIDHEMLAAVARRTWYNQDLQNYVRVLPTEPWLEVLPKRTVIDWLAHHKQISPSKSGRVVKTRQGGYQVFLGSKEAVSRCAIAVQNDESLPNIEPPESVLVTRLNRQGLLVSTEYLGTTPANSISLRYEWSDDEMPIPRSLLRLSRTNRDEEYQVMLKITVLKVSNKLPADAPSISIPPEDLPLGTTLSNRLVTPPTRSIIGGEAAREYYLYQRIPPIPAD